MGILEEILETNKAILAALTSNGSGGSTTTKSSKDTGSTTTKKKSKIKAEDITALVQPLTRDPAKKGKVKDVLSSFGLARLGEHTEDQRDALYEAFKAIAEEDEEETNDDDDDGLL